MEFPEEAEAVAAVIEIDREVGLEGAPVQEASTNHKNLGLLTLIPQRTTTMALKNEIKSSETKKGQSLANKKAIPQIRRKGEVISEAVVAQTEELVAVVAAGMRIVRNNCPYLTQRTATFKLLSKTRQKALLPLANKPGDKNKRFLIL